MCTAICTSWFAGILNIFWSMQNDANNMWSSANAGTFTAVYMQEHIPCKVYGHAEFSLAR
jgi:hypothetical protein